MKIRFMRLQYIMVCAACLLFSVVRGQEVVVPLMVNPVKAQQEIAAYTLPETPLSLPFVEDFSNGKWYPNPLKWMDANVFVNHDYPVGAPSVGVATFDAIDATGAVYENATPFPFGADTLTSRPIDLSSLKQSDSVYMSFFYQPQGIGNAPERDDSLVLEFWSEAEADWIHTWADQGNTLEDFVALHGKPFKMVILPIDSQLFFSNGFQFRFRNYASITDASLPDWGGNVDMWHLDYIVIKAGRSIQDTLIRNDIAFREYPRSLLKRYRSMPWNQYLANQTGEMHHEVSIPYSVYYHNMNAAVNQVYHVKSLTGGTSYTPSFYNFGNLAVPFDTVVVPNPGGNFGQYVFDAPSAPYADFELVAWIQPFSVPDEVIRTNDTVRYYQRFYNYYAYDDGTAEAGYGLSASNPNVRLSAAMRFDLNVPDTLRAIQIYFNQTKDLANDIEFTLMVWQGEVTPGGDTIPGDTLLTQPELRPVFIEGLNQFYTYELERPLPVNGTFFIGWEQRSALMLNVGFDRNHDSKQYLCFSIGGGWLKSQFAGTVMLRPILGDTAGAIVSVPEPERELMDVRLFPNPVTDKLHIEVVGDHPELSGEFQVEVFSTGGQRVTTARTHRTMDLGTLPAGLYLVRVTDPVNGVVLKQARIVVQTPRW
jgi:hypothetical protein